MEKAKTFESVQNILGISRTTFFEERRMAEIKKKGCMKPTPVYNERTGRHVNGLVDDQIKILQKQIAKRGSGGVKI